jgi:hypothetical protein
MADKRELNDALSSFLADHANRSGQAGVPSRDAPRDAGGGEAGRKTELTDAYQAIVDAYRAPRPVEPGTPPPSQAASAPASSNPAGKEQLLAAYDRLIEHEATKPKGFLPPLPAKWLRFAAPAVAVIALASSGYLWFAKPAWLYPRFDPMPAPTTEAKAEQILIATLFMVQQFEADSGRAPRDLRELGGDASVVSLIPTGGGGYRLATSIGNRTLSILVAPGSDPQIERGSP